MKSLFASRPGRGFAIFVLAANSFGCTAAGPPLPASRSAAPPSSISRKLLLRRDLASLPGYETRLYLIEYPPGVTAPLHHHPVEGLGYVVSGRFESKFQGENTVAVEAGQSFVERAGVAHTVFRNPDPSRPLKFVIAFVVARSAPDVVRP